MIIQWQGVISKKAFQEGLIVETCGSEGPFGMELEFADGDKEHIPLPSGYKWTDNKLTMMNNSDGS